MQNIADYIAYFKALADSHVNIASFLHGDLERYLQTERTINYDSLWLESPQMRYEGEDRGLMKVYAGALSVMCGHSRDDHDKADAALLRIETTIQDIVQRMHMDSVEEDLFIFNMGTAKMDIVEHFGSNHASGWQVEFEIRIPLGYCENEDAWQ